MRGHVRVKERRAQHELVRKQPQLPRIPRRRDGDARGALGSGGDYLRRGGANVEARGGEGELGAQRRRVREVRNEPRLARL